jgi:hypothetical protein
MTTATCRERIRTAATASRCRRRHGDLSVDEPSPNRASHAQRLNLLLFLHADPDPE